jgi:hypothetical protein
MRLADDRFGTYNGARYTAEHIPGARFIGYASCGHVWVGHHKEGTAPFCAQTVRSNLPALGSGSTRVWAIVSRGRGPRTGRPPPEGARVAYAPALTGIGLRARRSGPARTERP